MSDPAEPYRAAVERTRGTRPGGDAVARFDLAMQRAVGAGLAVACLLGVTTAVLGRSLYADWWWWGPGPLGFAATAAVAGLCLAGRFTGAARPAFVVVVSAAAVAAAAATGGSVKDVGTAMLPIVVITVVGIAFLAVTPAAALLAAAVIAADTLVPAVLRPEDAIGLLVQTMIQALILASGFSGGQVARRFAGAEERALDELARAVMADRAASAARAEGRELERELHDTVLSTLTALGRESLDDSAALRRRCAADAQVLRARARPAGTESLPDRLVAVIEPFAEDGFAVTLDVREPLTEVPPGVAEAMARATREALTNARRHSGAGSARVEVRPQPGGIEIRVSDRGVGLPEGHARRIGTRRSLVERLADVGGDADVAGAPGAGTTVTLRWPR